MGDGDVVGVPRFICLGSRMYPMYVMAYSKCRNGDDCTFEILPIAYMVSVQPCRGLCNSRLLNPDLACEIHVRFEGVWVTGYDRTCTRQD